MKQVLSAALVGVGLYALTPRGRATKPEAHFVRRHMREGWDWD